MALDVGRVEASLGAVVDDAGFLAFDKKVADADRKNAQAQLGFNVDDKKLAEFELKVKRASKMEATAELKLDKDDFDRSLKIGEAQMARLENKRAKAVLNLDVAGAQVAQAQIHDLERRLALIKDERVKVELDVDHRGLDLFNSALTRVQGRLASTGGGVARFNRLAQFLRNTLRSIGFFTLIAGAGAAVQALGALSAGVVALSGSLGSLSGALVAIPAGLSALVQGVGTGLLGLSGVGDAVKASMAQQAVATQDAGQAADKTRQATDNLSDAQQSARDAQKDLTTARREARAELGRLALEERGASLSLREARAELQRLRQDQSSTPIEIERGQLNLAEARERAKKATEDRSAAERKGVQGSEQVVQAERRLTQATKAVADAQREATKSASEGSSAANKLQREMDKLSPAGQRFARFLIALKPRFDELREVAQRGLLPGLERGITAAMANFGGLRRVIDVTARTMGRAGERFGQFLGNKDVGKDLELIGTRNARAMDRAARATQNFLSALRHILVAAGPFLDWLTKVTVRFSRLVDASSKAGRETGRMAAFFDRTRQTMQRLGSILQSVSAGLVGLGSSAKRYLGDFLLKELDRVSQKFEDFTESTEGQNRMREFFIAMRAPLIAIGGLIGDIVAAMLRLSTQPGLTSMVNQLRALVPVMEKVTAEMSKAFGPAVIATIASLVKLFGALAGATGPLTVFVKTIGTLADAFRWLIEHVPGLRHGLVGLVTAFAVFKTLNLASSALGITKFARALLVLGGAEQGATFGSVLIPKLRALGPKVKALIGSMFGRRVLSSTVAGSGEQLAMDFGGGVTSRLSRGLRRVKDILARIFGTAGSVAGTTAAGEAAGGLLPSLRTRLRRMAPALRTIGRIGIGAALAAGIVSFIRSDGDFQQRLRSAIETITLGIVPGIDKAARNAAQLTKLVQGIGVARESELPKLRKIADAQSKILGFTKAQRAELAKAFAERERADQRGVKPRPKAKDEKREPKVQTIEVDPVVGVEGLPTGRGIRRQMDRVAAVIRREFDQLHRLMRRRASRLGDVFDDVKLIRGRDPFGLERALRRSGDDSESLAKRIARRIGEAFESISRFARIEGRETGDAFGRGLQESARNAERRVEQMKNRVVSDFRAMSRIGGAEARELVTNLRETFRRLPTTIEGPTADVLRIVASAMRTLGASGSARIRASAERIEGRAFGGTIPGYSTVDDRLIAVRGGEEVLTPEVHSPMVNAAMAFASQFGVVPFGSTREMFQRTGAAFAKGGQVTQKIVQRVVPAAIKAPADLVQNVTQRFAKGGQVEGIVPIPGQPGESIHRSILRDVVTLTKRYKLRVTDGYAPSGHAAGGEHPKGLAIDAVPGPGGSWALIDKLAAWAEPRQGSPRPPFRWVGYTGDSGHGRGNHIHLSWGGKGSIARASRVRTKVAGPRGAIRDTVAGAVKQVERAANRRIGREEAPTTSGPIGKGGPMPGGDIPRTIVQVGRSFKASPKVLLAAMEAGIVESGLRNLAGGDRDSAGVFQQRPSQGWGTFKQVTNPVYAARQFFTRAIRADRPGMSAGKLAQSVQRSAFPGRYDAVRAKAASILKRFGIRGLARGGFVGRAIQRFAAGGLVRPAIKDTPPAGAKRPTRRKATAKGKKQRGIKPRRLGRARHHIPTGLLSGFEGADSDLAEGSPIFEDYNIAIDDAGIVDEQFIVDDAAGNQTVDWTAVRFRISELNGLIERANAIQAKMTSARDFALRIIAELKRVAREQLQRVAAVYKQLQENIGRLLRLKRNLQAEKRKSRRNRDEKTIRHVEGLIADIERENLRLGGTRDVLPRNGPEIAESAPNSVLGGIWGILNTVSDELDKDGTGVVSKLIDYQGSTGRGGRLREIGKDLASYAGELGDLQPGGRLVKITAPAGETAAGATTQDIQNFLVQFSQLRREFAPNFRILPNFAGGGKVPGRSGEPVEAIVHGGELIHDPKTGKLMVVIKQPKEGQAKQVNIDARSYFKEVPADPHSWSNNVAYELKAAL